MIPRLPFIILALFLIYWIIITSERHHAEYKEKINRRHATLVEQEYQRQLEAMQRRVDEYISREHEKTCQRIMDLSQKPNPTEDEIRELAWIKAAQIENI